MSRKSMAVSAGQEVVHLAERTCGSYLFRHERRTANVSFADYERTTDA